MFPDFIFGHKIEIQIIRPVSRSDIQPHRIDKIGTFFERLYGKTFITQQTRQSYGNSSFPRIPFSGGNVNSLNNIFIILFIFLGIFNVNHPAS
jgi:hypothetical protein